MSKSQTDFSLNGTSIVKSFWNHRKAIILVTLIACVTSLVVSFFIPQKFKATAILIPQSANTSAKDIFLPEKSTSISHFGSEKEVELLLQTLSSSTLRKEVIAKENLVEHYGLDPSSSRSQFVAERIFSKENVSFSRSEYRTVKITVYDRDTEKAAQIGNTIIVIADSLVKKMKRDLLEKALVDAKKLYAKALDQYNQDYDSLQEYVNKGIMDISMQSKELTKVYAQTLASGDRNSIKRVENYLSLFQEHGTGFIKYQRSTDRKEDYLADFQKNILFLELEVEETSPNAFVVDWATPTTRKSKPKKIEIVLISSLSVFFFAIFIAILMDFFNTSILSKAKNEE